MGALRDDAPMEWELVDPNEPGLTVDEAYALLAGIGPESSTAKLPPTTAGNQQPSANVTDNTGR